MFASLTEKGGIMHSTLVFLFISVLSFASAQDGEPRNWCYRDCSPEQERIWSAFENSSFGTELVEPMLFSGACYHLSPHYRNTDTHHAVFYFSRIENDLITHIQDRQRVSSNIGSAIRQI